MVTSDVVATSIGDDREAAKEVIEANPLKIRLMEEVTKEDIRALQLESLLEAFQSAVDEKEQLIVLESVILEDIREVKLKVDDEIILKELTNAIDDKRRMIDSEKVICKEITAVSVSLAKEILETRNKIEKLQNFVATFPENFGNDGKEGAQSYEMLLQSSIEVTYYYPYFYVNHFPHRFNINHMSFSSSMSQIFFLYLSFSISMYPFIMSCNY